MLGFSGGAMVKNPPANAGDRFNPWVRKIPWSRKWQPVPVFFPGKSHGPRSLEGYSPWGCKDWGTETDTHRHTHTQTHKLFQNSLQVPYCATRWQVRQWRSSKQDWHTRLLGIIYLVVINILGRSILLRGWWKLLPPPVQIKWHTKGTSFVYCGGRWRIMTLSPSLAPNFLYHMWETWSWERIWDFPREHQARAAKTKLLIFINNTTAHSNITIMTFYSAGF